MSTIPSHKMPQQSPCPSAHHLIVHPGRAPPAIPLGTLPFRTYRWPQRSPSIRSYATSLHPILRGRGQHPAEPEPTDLSNLSASPHLLRPAHPPTQEYCQTPRHKHCNPPSDKVYTRNQLRGSACHTRAACPTSAIQWQTQVPKPSGCVRSTLPVYPGMWPQPLDAVSAALAVSQVRLQPLVA